MKIFQLIDWLTKLFKLNNRSKVILLILLPLPIFSQNNAAFWLGKRAAVSDPYFSNVSLLLHMDGANGSTTFTDDSNNNFTVTANGNAQISTTQSKFGGASGYFDGIGDYLSISSNTAFNYGSGDFTIEGWFRSSNVTLLQTVFSQISGNPDVRGIAIRIFNSKVAFLTYTPEGNPSLIVGDISTISSNTWYHFAATKQGNTYRFFLNGNLEDTETATITSSWDSKSIRIGSWIDITGRDFNGYIDDLRITKGVARYTSNFTPPTAPFPNN